MAASLFVRNVVEFGKSAFRQNFQLADMECISLTSMSGSLPSKLVDDLGAL